ncbi:serine/threonine-protein kinase [Asanoa sp. WMMD1127]|uniref:serine/threonine-protein kinase n=1 Tax=Asanoa sp. WMMD1127 TaxID=3016107 RepID=UPI002417544D|nr:serine/threonine-protein kinase [Asanoa sp. WMMD1127]MDG4826491.1 serine/threonine-protein kinase [Asanoa sp. WMMD1127]
MAGRRLADRYELEDVLARGGMGVVWRGRDLRLDRPVAVKLVAGDALDDPTLAARFDREARAVARLNHPNIVAVYDFGSDGGDSYLVMELVSGRSIAAALADGPLPVADAVSVAAQVCAGLTAAHAAGVVHRDVKPANLIRTPAGVVKICDFGIAHLRQSAGEARLTGDAIAMGSTSYMAPEQINDEPVDERTDLYGLGCALYAMLAGRPPFVGATPLSVVHQQVTAAPPEVRDARPEAPEALARLVRELLAKSPADRPADAAAVVGRLAALEVTAPPDVPARRGRRRLVWGVAAATAAAAVVSLLAATRDDGPGSVAAAPSAVGSASPAAVVPVATRSPATATTAPALPAPPSPSPSTRSPSPSRTRPAPESTTPGTSRPPRPPVDPVVHLHRTIDAQAELPAKTAEDLHKRVDDIARHQEEGDDEGVAKRIRELRTKLADLHGQGKLTLAGPNDLVRGVDALAAARA